MVEYMTYVMNNQKHNRRREEIFIGIPIPSKKEEKGTT